MTLYRSYNTLTKKVLQYFRERLIIPEPRRYQHVSSKQEKWIQPQGYTTEIKIYNTIVKHKTPLILPNQHVVSWYMCGPTVYDSAHIGHASCYVHFDIIRRILENIFNIRPVIALGITDIDDKIIKRSNMLNVTCESLAKQYEIEFFKNMADLNVLLPTTVTRVTEFIPQIILFIQQIIDKRQAYVTPKGDVYFNTLSYSNYGKLVNVPEPTTNLKDGKKNSLDFALWKSSKPDEPWWNSPWGEGKGRPGWHIECSAMATCLFGDKLDLHSGGIDLKFPHHENEEAQSCSYHGIHQWVNYWLHSGHLLLKDEKMSKSLKNTISIDEFLKEYTANHFRLYCLLKNYRTGVEYSSAGMEKSVAIHQKMLSFFSTCEFYVKGKLDEGNINEVHLMKLLEETKQKVRASLADDFDTPICIAALEDLMSETNKMLSSEKTEFTSSRSPAVIASIADYISNIFKDFGLNLETLEKNTSENTYKLHYILDEAVKFRNEVRKHALTKPFEEKNVKKNLLQACDSLRDNFKAIGIQVNDVSKSESTWSISKENEQ